MMAGETVFALRAWDAEALHKRLSEAAPDDLEEVELLGPAEGFTPGAFTRMRLDLYLPAGVFPEPRRALDRYLCERYVPYSLRRDDERGTRYRFEVPRKGLKKRVLFGGTFQVERNGFAASLEVGPRFDLFAWLDLFAAQPHASGKSLSRHVRASVSDLTW